MKVLIVGNIIKDVYLELGDADANFEIDSLGTPWLDFAFDGGSHKYAQRTSVFAGAAITMEVLQKMGCEPAVSGRDIKTDASGRVLEFSDGKPCEVYRYILTHDGHTAYIVPEARPVTKLTAPAEAVDWIFIDRSAQISEEMVQDLDKYLEVTPDTKVAVFISSKGCGCAAEVEMRDSGDPGSRIFSKADQELIKRADIVFSDGSLFGLTPKGTHCEISDSQISMDGKSQNYTVRDDDYITHLTIYTILASTIFAAILDGYSTEDALSLAALNLEHAKNTHTLTKDELNDLLEEKREAKETLRMNAKSLVAFPKGILAADESGGSIHKKFEAAGIPDDESHRRDYRNIFFTTSELEKYVNGVILFEETAYQLSDDGNNFTEYLTAKGIIPGIKVDQGLEPFAEPGYETEKWTKGLEGLPERLKKYYASGLRFAKWRAAFEITFSSASGEVRTPSKMAIVKNAEILAAYARDCQNAGIVPIVEPEVVHDGDYDIETCARVTGQILDELFRALRDLNVDLEACILKCNMVLAGGKYHTGSTPEEVGAATAKTLREHVPKELAGVVFLSGGQGVEQATENLQAVTNNGPFDWPVTFSYARALQGPALDAWQGNNDNADAAREGFKARLIANCDALNKK